MPSTIYTDSERNAWYPLHVSDRADELIGEVSEAQCERLFRELQTSTLPEWWNWLEDEREQIAEYDSLSAAVRNRRLQSTGDNSVLRLHHAAVWLELWRARTHSRFFPLPPNGQRLDDPAAQRSMMLAVVASYHDAEPADYWPFEYPSQPDGKLFQGS